MKGKIEAEHLYQWLVKVFKNNAKTSWEKNELLEAVKELYVQLLKMDKQMAIKRRREQLSDGS